MIAELDDRGIDIDLRLHLATDEDLVEELKDRDYVMDDDDEDDSPAIDGDLGADLEFCRDALLRHRPAEALAMLERVLYPNNPAAMAEAYKAACADRDPVTNRPRA
jgi:hypothetical protein